MSSYVQYWEVANYILTPYLSPIHTLVFIALGLHFKSMILSLVPIMYLISR